MALRYVIRYVCKTHFRIITNVGMHYLFTKLSSIASLTTKIYFRTEITGNACTHTYTETETNTLPIQDIRLSSYIELELIVIHHFWSNLFYEIFFCFKVFENIICLFQCFYVLSRSDCLEVIAGKFSLSYSPISLRGSIPLTVISHLN